MRALPAVLALLPLAGCASAPAPAPAAASLPAPEPCADSRTVAHDLATGYGEQPIRMGITPDGNLMLLYASAGGRTWTLVRALPDGRSCIVEVGGYWQELGQGI